MTPLTIKQLSNANFSIGSGGSTSLTRPPIRIKHYNRHTAGDLMIPSNFTYVTPQHKLHAAGEKRTPVVNKNVQQINSEEEASVLSRYPFHGNRALPSRGHAVQDGWHRGSQRWSLIDVNNNRLDGCEGQSSEIEVMLQPVVTECRSAQRTVLIREDGGGKREAAPHAGRTKRQLTNIRSHSSNNKIHYKSPPMRRYSNVYDYTYMSDPSLNAIHEDSDSQG